MDNDITTMFSFKPQAVELANGQTVHLRRFSAADRLQLMAAVKTLPEEQELERAYDIQALVLAMCICDENGNRLFGDDLKVVKDTISDGIFNAIAPVAFEINGLGSEAQGKIKKK